MCISTSMRTPGEKGEVEAAPWKGRGEVANRFKVTSCCVRVLVSWIEAQASLQVSFCIDLLVHDMNLVHFKKDADAIAVALGGHLKQILQLICRTKDAMTNRPPPHC